MCLLCLFYPIFTFVSSIFSTSPGRITDYFATLLGHNSPQRIRCGHICEGGIQMPWPIAIPRLLQEVTLSVLDGLIGAGRREEP